MKRTFALISILFFIPALAFADNFYSATEVFQQAGVTWEKVYDAYDRRIEIIVDIHTPAVDQVPILRIAPHDPLPITQSLIDSVDEFENSKGMFSVVKNPNPMSAPSQDISSNITYHKIVELDDDVMYAENNPLTWGGGKSRGKKATGSMGIIRI